MSDAYRDIFDIKSGTIMRVKAADRAVPWLYKAWGQFTDADKDALRAHFTTFDDNEKLMGYKKYLRDHVGVPADWLEIPPAIKAGQR